MQPTAATEALDQLADRTETQLTDLKPGSGAIVAALATDRREPKVTQGRPATASALGFDFNPAVFTAMTWYVCFVPATAFVSVYRIGTRG